jgi:general secretion pathway protein C
MNWQSFSQYLNSMAQRLPHKLISQVSAVLLIVLAGWLLARLSWLIIPQPASDSWQPQLGGGSAASASVPDVQRLLSFALFGKAEERATVRPEPVVTEAPKTRLNVKLTGLVSGLDPAMGSAVIESRGAEFGYAVGDSIEGTNATLYQVFNDRVLLSVAGRFETLMLDGVEFTRIAEANVGLGREDEPETIALPAQPMAPRVNSAELAAQREALLAEPMRFFEFIRVTPERRGNEMLGFRLMPGRDPGMFQRLGFRPNDLAVEINGIPLNDLQQANMAMEQLREASDASVRIERDGELIDIQFNLSQ